MFFHVMGPDGRLLHRIPVRRAMSPECSPDGRWIAFVDGGKPGYPLVRVDLDTNREVVLNSSKTAGVAVSADGTRVAQLSEEPDELRVLPAAGGAPLRSYSLPSGNNAMPGVVRWTPDGKGLAYVDRSGAGNVWIQRLEGGPPRQLTKLNNEWVLSFDWSFDGNQLGMIRAVMVQDVVTIRERPVP
jgi:Tol biopolymer transport system component